jgi:hypothetical protein
VGSWYPVMLVELVPSVAAGDTALDINQQRSRRPKGGSTDYGPQSERLCRYWVIELFCVTCTRLSVQSVQFGTASRRDHRPGCPPRWLAGWLMDA